MSQGWQYGKIIFVDISKMEGNRASCFCQFGCYMLKMAGIMSWHCPSVVTFRSRSYHLEWPNFIPGMVHNWDCFWGYKVSGWDQWQMSLSCPALQCRCFSSLLISLGVELMQWSLLLQTVCSAVVLCAAGAIPCEEGEGKTRRSGSASEGRHRDLLRKIHWRCQVLLYAGMSMCCRCWQPVAFSKLCNLSIKNL